MNDPSNVLDKVCRSLGRSAPLVTPPTPPVLPEHVVRLVHTDFGLPELFAKRAAELKMLVESCYVEELAGKMIEFLKANDCKKIGISVSKLLNAIGLPHALRDAGLDVKTWDELTLDAAYDLDAGVTDVTYAVAETGSLVIRTNANHGRSLSLVPKYHIAVLEPKNFVPDLLDLMEKLTADGVGSHVTLISGPSKTADIEMNVVTGVHGPNVVKAFLLS
jgi:L-lactate dehydrogenase complex protein LldG